MSLSTPILITAINARHSHSSMGGRCLLANMGELRGQTELVEFTIQQSAVEIADAIVARNPGVLALGVYIWNVKRVREVLPLLREQLPDIQIVMGGPELPARGRTGSISDDFQSDFLILGEGDLAFASLCRDRLAGQPIERVLMPPLPDLNRIEMPYEEYSDEDLAHRLLYVESSRGCAMRCDYCVSANESAVRFFPMPALLAAFDRLLARGAQQFKFCDRSFNLDVPRAVEILSFFLERMPQVPDLFLHFEMLPDRFPDELRKVLVQFPPRSLQLEIGLQSFDTEVLERIRRPQNLDRAAEAIQFLRTQTNAWIHADLIAGLPGETPEQFAAGFDRLVAIGPHEIQLGILKKLPGAPIDRHDAEFEMQYDSAPPYEIRSTWDWPAEHLVRTARFAHYWDAIVNSGRFIAAAPLIWKDTPSVFSAFLDFADWMGERFPQEHGNPLGSLVEALFEYLTDLRDIPTDLAADALIRGYRHTGARDIPVALAPHLKQELPPPTCGLSRALRRQFLHWTWEEANPMISGK
jgi:Radical SAM superfamily/Protein of unknown function (DUF4080)